MQKDEELVRVPIEALLTANSVPKDFHNRHPSISVHGILASYLAFGGMSAHEYDPWRATWPSIKDFEESMPIHWPQHCQDALPYDAKSVLLENQTKKFEKDWKIVVEAFPQGKRSAYLYYWLIVNTRSFYFEAADLIPSSSADDRMVLCPIVDYFNHNDEGVS